MTEQRLTQKEKELIACGAAVSAGCQKCANYHFKQAFEEGATKAEIQGAVAAATCVIGSSGEIMQRKAYALMEIEREEVPEQCSDEQDRMTVLVKIAAAVAANNTNNIERYLKMAKTEDNRAQLLVQGMSRFMVRKFVEGEPYLQASVEHIEEEETKDTETEAMMANILGLFILSGDVQTQLRVYLAKLKSGELDAEAIR